MEKTKQELKKEIKSLRSRYSSAIDRQVRLEEELNDLRAKNAAMRHLLKDIEEKLSQVGD